MRVPFLDLKRNYESIQREIYGAIGRVVASSAFIGGKFVQTFEEEFAAFQHARFCVGVGNGTDALEIVLAALELPVGGEVLVPANSFIATSEAVSRAGYRVVFCDCDPETGNISVTDAESRISPRTAAIIPVHLYGRPCAMDNVIAFARRHSIKVIEDCAQAHGASYRGQLVGTFGDAGTFSFYPGKNLGAYGDGGAIVTNSEETARKCRMIANHGRISKYDHEFEGRNSRLDGIQAAILSAKLRHLDAWNAARRRHSALYDRLLAGSGFKTPLNDASLVHVFHLYTIETARRDEIRAGLASAGIESGIHYPIPLPLLKAYHHLGCQADDFPAATKLAGRTLSLPMFPELTEAELNYTVETLKQLGATHRCAE